MARPSKKNYLLKVIRESKGISPDILAEHANTTTFNLWRLETGQNVANDIAYKVAEKLGISSDVVFYSLGRFPPDKEYLIKDDPLLVKEVMDKFFNNKEKHHITKDYINSLLKIKSEIPKGVIKILSRIKSYDD